MVQSHLLWWYHPYHPHPHPHHYHHDHDYHHHLYVHESLLKCINFLNSFISYRVF